MICRGSLFLACVNNLGLGSLSADEQFLMMLKEKCSMTDSEWEERQKTRQLEMEACSKALAVLSSDDAPGLLEPTCYLFFNPSLSDQNRFKSISKRFHLRSASSQKVDSRPDLTRCICVEILGHPFHQNPTCFNEVISGGSSGQAAKPKSFLY